MIGRFEKKRFFNLLESLSKTPGPSLGEKPRRAILEAYFSDNHLPYETDRAGNLLIKLGQGDWTDAVVFDAHIDVVQAGYTAMIHYGHGTMHGLGLGDNLTAVALLALFAEAMTHNQTALKRPMAFFFTVGEEGLGNLKGINQVIMEHPLPPYVFISFDLSFEQYSVAALGSVRYAIEAICPGGHSWEDYGTPSAIDQLMDFFSDLKKKFSMLSSEHPGELSFNIGTFDGGEGINSISRTAQANFEFRSVNPSYLIDLDLAVQAMVYQMNHRNGLTLSCTETGRRPASKPVKPERIEPLAISVLTSIGETPGSVVRSTNINATLAAGWPSLCMGLCKSGRFHSTEEYVVTDSIEKGWKVLSRLTETLVYGEDKPAI